MSGRNLEIMLSFHCLTGLVLNFLIFCFVFLAFVYLCLCLILRCNVLLFTLISFIYKYIPNNNIPYWKCPLMSNPVSEMDRTINNLRMRICCFNLWCCPTSLLRTLETRLTGSVFLFFLPMDPCFLPKINFQIDFEVVEARNLYDGVRMRIGAPVVGGNDTIYVTVINNMNQMFVLLFFGYLTWCVQLFRYNLN